MELDNALNSVVKDLANVRWRNTPFPGLQWYYAENRQYVLKYNNGRTEHFMLVDAKSPSEAARKAGFCADNEQGASNQEEIDLARKFFDFVFRNVEAVLDDAIYEFIDPENKCGTKICQKLNLETVREVLALGFKQKYGEDWQQERDNKNLK